MPTARVLNSILALLVALCFSAGCSDRSAETGNTGGESTAAKIERIANEFVDGYYHHYPEVVYEVGYVGAPMDRFGDHSEATTASWNARVDAWLAELDSIDLETVEESATARTYVFAREKLQALVDKRVCRMDLWDISSTWTGWPYMFASCLLYTSPSPRDS